LLVLGMLVLPLAGASASVSAQPAPESGSSDWLQVSVGAITTCGIRTTGRLYCWGYGEGGELGDGGTSSQEVPTEVAGGGTNWRSVSVGAQHACAIKAPGRLYCWGNDFYGPLGDGMAGGSRNVPTLVVGGFTDWTSVSTGRSFTCGRRANGRVYCWGRDLQGQLGTGPGLGDRSNPGLVAGGFTNWTSVDAGDYFACGRRANGRLYCWGENAYGQLGNGNQTADQQTPSLVQGGITDWASVSAGGSHTCGIRQGGQLLCWGDGEEGQRGGGDTTQAQTTPLVVSDFRWSQVSAGTSHTCGRRTNGRLYCWGQSLEGQLGSGTFGPAPVETTTVQVSGGATDWQSVSAGYRNTCARTRSGRLYCWGYDLYGQLGNGDASTDDDPSEVFAP
jgi:alpha-tubulin suppressor-like RCC1 family protein